MEWVETTAKSVEEAKDLALDQLGVDESDAEFEVVEEPRPGLFGRVRGEARVRARVRPTRPRPKVDRRERRRRPKDEGAPASAPQDAEPAAVPAAAPADDDESREESEDPDAEDERKERESSPRRARATVAAGAGGPAVDEPIGERADVGEASETSDVGDEARPEDVAAAAAAFLQGLADAFGLTASTSFTINGDDVEVRLEGDDLGVLIGPRGQTLLALQDLARTVSQRGITGRGRLHIDVGAYRQRRREALGRFTTDVARQVLDSGVPRMLEPMASADRKVVHDTAGAIAGVETRSEGEEPNRRVVILPTSR